jgi:hypothetical protein
VLSDDREVLEVCELALAPEAQGGGMPLGTALELIRNEMACRLGVCQREEG